MEYKSILDRIEEQKKVEDLSVKLFRYAGLIQAIEFFSQKLNFEQIIEAGFDFVNELLTIGRSAVFVLEGDSYVLRKIKGFDNAVSTIKNNDKLQSFALLNGSLIFDRALLKEFFDEEILDAYSISVFMPLIIESTLFGFIFISNKTTGPLNDEDYIISEALIKLLNNALENYRSYEQLQKANRELDEKIFNLFAINQSSKALLSELSLDSLYSLSVDVFSELTQNSITGFVLYDEKSEKHVLRAFKDICYTCMDAQISLTLNKGARIDANKVIIKLCDERDAQYFNDIFIEGAGVLAPLRPDYIILLIKNNTIAGFVTLGQSITGTEYKHSMFELIESLASSTYIALSNAMLFKQVNEQKKMIQGKLDKLITLNNLMKNINSSLDVDTLIDITLKTLEVSFFVEKAVFALYDKEKNAFNLYRTLNIETAEKEIAVNGNWKRVMEGDRIYRVGEAAVFDYMGEKLASDIDVSPGIVIFPIYIDRVEIEVLGVLIVFKYKNTAIDDTENMITLETVAGHIAPAISNLFTIEAQKKFLLPNYTELFKKDLTEAIEETFEVLNKLEVFYICDKRDLLFKDNAIIDRLKGSFRNVYPFTQNNIFIINMYELDADQKIELITGTEDIAVRKMVLGKDFNNLQEFLALF
ncbi:GAF domain-containing protein [Anaerobacterium chartisolvens]|uniref:GAF domain-containing protein n=1 Tax=Anaerobacterium chartisolvens TaxID=1297424 RepID=A0A369B3I9_9FIRM|nr:GAF domain-containing protein [Anaerobacterium chartisolvens]RCX16073.1 GAF domain-containing protein [Anaerobacterium chartisolvens]